MSEDSFEDEYILPDDYELDHDYEFDENENIVEYEEEYDNSEDAVDYEMEKEDTGSSQNVIDLFDIEPISTAQRIAMFPEMHQLRPTKRRGKADENDENDDVLLKDDESGDKKLKFRLWDKSEALMCVDCGYCYKSVVSMRKHLKFHELGVPIPTPGFLCPYADCDVRCDCQATVNEHVRIQHDRPEILNETFVFNKWTDFERWKTNLEETTSSRFVYSSGRINLVGTVKRYSCFYAAVPSRQPAQRTPHRQRRPRKLERSCTAHLCVKETYSQVVVRACLAHCGHDTTTARDLPLTNEIRKEIATALIQGAKDQEIMESMRESSTPDDRRYYIQPYEIRNIYHKIRRKVSDQVINEFCRQACEEQKDSPTPPLVDEEEDLSDN